MFTKPLREKLNYFCYVFGLQKPESNLHFILDHGKSDLAKITKNTYRRTRFTWILAAISISLYSDGER